MEEYLNNNEEVMETSEEFATEVTTETTPAVYPSEVYVPVSTESDSSDGPNKALIAIGAVGGLLIGKKLYNKFAKPRIEARKAKKAQEEEERIMKVLAKTGLVKPVEATPETKSEPVVDVPAEEVQAVKPDETKAEDKKEDKK